MLRPEWTIIKLLNWTTSYFKSHNIESPRAAAEILLSHALKLKRIDLYLQYDRPLDKTELANFKTLIKRRVAREPVAYITGKKEFWSMELEVARDVLIPRPDTECLVETALKIISSKPDNIPKQIIELGTGSGAIIIALAAQKPGNIFFASDFSIKALKLARKNAWTHNLNKKINFFSGSWFLPLSNRKCRFDIIISNPPYIKSSIINKLEPEIYRYEPVLALDGGKDGLNSLGLIISTAHLYLKDKGSLLLEIGSDQKNAVEAMISSANNYENVFFTKDYSGFNRVVQMDKKGVLN